MPGPTSVPTGALPKRPRFGRTNEHVRFEHASTVGSARLPSQAAIGALRRGEPRVVPVPDDRRRC